MTAALGVPDHAQQAWRLLHEEITRGGGTPCADETIRDLFTGSALEQTIAANHCLDCPVLNACATYALTADEREGVWGGLTAAQRTARQGGAA